MVFGSHEGGKRMEGALHIQKEQCGLTYRKLDPPVERRETHTIAASRLTTLALSGMHSAILVIFGVI